MAPQSRIFFSVIISFSFIACCTSLKDDLPPHNYVYDLETGYAFQAFPSYFSTLEDGIFTDKQLQSSNGIEMLATASAKTVSVDSFGAKGDGKSDDTEAFKEAWKEACSSTGAVFVVPKNKKYLVKQIRFEGPCKAALTVQIYGTILASNDRSDYKKDGRHWLIFDSVQNLAVSGGGIVDGNGKTWWENSCKVDKDRPCTEAPTALTFYKGNNLTVKNLKIQNAQQIQVTFERCVNVQASGLTVTAPEDSPNTDGIHITSTENMQLSSCDIGTGDDCISIETGTQKLQVSDITCGPGHGISIGSLGDGNSEAHVSDITVNGAKLTETMNGVRIKTYQGGSGSASNIRFENIDMQNVENPIIIDQNYCDQAKPCKQQKSAVQVRNVVYKSIKGTSASEVAISFNCSQSYPCQGIVLQDIDLKGEEDEAVKAECNNVNLKQSGSVSPQCGQEVEKDQQHAYSI